MATKLKHLKVKKVDFVDEGANPEAHIKLYKSKDGAEISLDEKGEKSSGVWKRLIAFVAKAAGMKQEEIDSAIEEIQKGDSESFGEKYNEAKNRKIADEMWDICFALQSSLYSILNDDDLDSTSASTSMQDSLDEFYEVVKDSIKQWSNGKATSITKKNEEVTETDLEVMKSAVNRLNDTIEKAGSVQEGPTIKNKEPKGEKEMSNIDKSKMTPAERAFYEEIEKRYGKEEVSAPAAGSENPAPGTGEVENPVTKSKEQPPQTIPAQQTTGDNGADDIYKGLHPAVKAEMEALRKFREDAEDREIHEVAKRYTLIGKKEEELFPVLKSLKTTGGTAYNDMITVLDQAVETVEKSGAFSEIGKSGGAGNGAGSDAWARAEVKAADIMKSKAGISKAEALDEVFKSDPALAQECEKEA